MNSKTVLMACAGSALIGLIIGFGVGRTTGANGNSEAEAMNSSGQSSSAGSNYTASSTMSGADGFNVSRFPQLGNVDINDPVAAIARANELSSNDRYAYLESVYTEWGKRSGEEAAQWALANLKGSRKSDSLYYIADGWADADPAAAAEWFNTNTTGEILEDGMWEILEAWGGKDPQAALAWIVNVDEYTQANIMDGLAEGWAAVDPRAAAAAGMKFLDRVYGEDFLITVATQWAGKNPQEAGAWAEAIPQQGARVEVLLELGTEWAMTDPADAAVWATGLDDPTDKGVAQVGIALGWSEHDPGAAVDWAVATIADPLHISRAVEEIMMNWSESDPNGAATWLNNRPQGKETDSILTTFSDSVVELDPIAAITWAGTISDETKRNAQVESLLEEWVAIEGEAARGEILKMDLPEALKQKFSQPTVVPISE